MGGQSLTPSEKGFGILNSVGAILFAYSFSMILIEIQVRATSGDRQTWLCLRRAVAVQCLPAPEWGMNSRALTHCPSRRPPRRTR